MNGWHKMKRHDDFLKPIVPKKYGVGIVVKNCTSQILHALEPWCDQIFVDMDYDYYIESEQKNTKFNMKDRVYGIHSQVNTNVEVRVDGNRFANSEFGYIQKLSEIISDSGEIGTFNLGTLEVSIKNMETYENNLITN